MTSEKLKTINLSISLYPQQLAVIHELGINLSQYVQGKIEEEFCNSNSLRIKIEEKASEIDFLKQRLKEIEKREVGKTTIHKNELEFLEETGELFNKKGYGFLEGRTNLFNNTFKTNISSGELLNKIRKMKGG